MLINIPYKKLSEKSTLLRRFIKSFSSEQWSFIGFLTLVASGLAGYYNCPWTYGLLLVFHTICDLNDGYVYQSHEQGITNGYGFYLDHILDSIGIAFAVFGGYCITLALWNCLILILLFYLIAIHSWLYKVVKVAHGEQKGQYYNFNVSKRLNLSLDVDDLKMLAAIAIITNWFPLIILINITLFGILLEKITKTIFELRSTLWRKIN